MQILLVSYEFHLAGGGVYHNNAGCSSVQAMKIGSLVPGTGGLDLCERCESLMEG